jgi:hypothetical protein
MVSLVEAQPDGLILLDAVLLKPTVLTQFYEIAF